MLLTLVTIATAVGLPAQDSGYARQSSTGRVTLEVWPQWRDTVLAVQVRATTHAVELGILRLSGHHAVAEVLFRLAERLKRFTITIRDVPDVAVRSLTWPPGSSS